MAYSNFLKFRIHKVKILNDEHAKNQVNRTRKTCFTRYCIPVTIFAKRVPSAAPRAGCRRQFVAWSYQSLVCIVHVGWTGSCSQLRFSSLWSSSGYSHRLCPWENPTNGSQGGSDRGNGEPSHCHIFCWLLCHGSVFLSMRGSHLNSGALPHLAVAIELLFVPVSGQVLSRTRNLHAICTENPSKWPSFFVSLKIALLLIRFTSFFACLSFNILN